MASGTITLTRSGSGLLDGRIIWSSVSNGSVANTSTVTASLQIRRNSTTSTTTGTFKGTFTVGDESVSISSSLELGYDWVTLKTLTDTVSHDSSGAGSCYLYAKINGPSGTSMANTYVEGTKTVSLDTIAKPSVIDSVGDVTLGNSCSVTWTPKSATFRYKLKFAMGTWEHTTDAIHPNKTTAYTYTSYKIPLEVACDIPYDTTGEMTVTLYTYSDSGATTQVGSADSETFKVTVPDNKYTKPSVSMYLYPVSSLGSAFDGLYIQGKTMVKAELSAEGKYLSPIDYYRMKVEDKTYTSEICTSEFLSNYGSTKVYGYATDYRGYTGSTEESITVIAYSSPRISVDVCGRCDENGHLTDTGTYLKIKATRSYHDVKSGDVQKNFCKIRYRYKATSASSWSDWTTILEANNLSSNTVETDALLGGALAKNTTYLVQVQAIDDIGDYAETTITIPTEEVYWHRTKNALGLGKYAEGERLLDVGWDAHFHGEVRIGETGMTLKEYILAVISEGG